MTSMFTTDTARQIVSDRLRDAEGRRLARRFGGRRAAQAGNAGSGATERVVRRERRRAVLLSSDVISAR